MCPVHIFATYFVCFSHISLTYHTFLYLTIHFSTLPYNSGRERVVHPHWFQGGRRLPRRVNDRLGKRHFGTLVSAFYFSRCLDLVTVFFKIMLFKPIISNKNYMAKESIISNGRTIRNNTRTRGRN